MDYTILAPVVAGAIRNVAGWLESSLKDGKVSAYEWGQLGSSMLQVVVISVAAYFGLGADIMTASGLGVLGSIGISTLKKVGNE